MVALASATRRGGISSTSSVRRQVIQTPAPPSGFVLDPRGKDEPARDARDDVLRPRVDSVCTQREVPSGAHAPSFARELPRLRLLVPAHGEPVTQRRDVGLERVGIASRQPPFGPNRRAVSDRWRA